MRQGFDDITLRAVKPTEAEAKPGPSARQAAPRHIASTKTRVELKKLQRCCNTIAGLASPEPSYPGATVQHAHEVVRGKWLIWGHADGCAAITMIGATSHDV
eukprot:gnl/Chilomastix_cuspidata/8168.p2 GENE.gnl/Chilomastix_cuspidata/8168~~gnl/Chilomastix_cuspidata/8168.p2  ORF type:complete len:102 (+),score=1.43 gnl/Chilomastix_cuspidata/8168:174-479(+)